MKQLILLMIICNCLFLNNTASASTLGFYDRSAIFLRRCAINLDYLFFSKPIKNIEIRKKYTKRIKELKKADKIHPYNYPIAKSNSLFVNNKSQLDLVEFTNERGSWHAFNQTFRKYNNDYQVKALKYSDYINRMHDEGKAGSPIDVYDFYDVARGVGNNKHSYEFFKFALKYYLEPFFPQNSYSGSNFTDITNKYPAMALDFYLKHYAPSVEHLDLANLEVGSKGYKEASKAFIKVDLSSGMAGRIAYLETEEEFLKLKKDILNNKRVGYIDKY